MATIISTGGGTPDRTPDYATKLIVHVATADGGSVGSTRVRIRNEELGVYLVKPLDALGNAEFDVLQNHTYYVVLIDYPSKYYGVAALITATGGQVQRETITLPTEPDRIGWRVREDTGEVQYTDGAVDWVPASMMDGTFEPGSLGGSWLFKNIRPCLLKNGVVQYYLNPDDFTKKTDGTAADITSGNDGDVMIEFPLVYYKFYEETGADGVGWKGCKFSRTQSDDTYCANAFLSEAGVIQNTMYMAAYEGVVYENKLRSLSGVPMTRDKTFTAYRTYATANGPGYQQHEWCKRSLIQALFIMMFRGLDSQALLGCGVIKIASKDTGQLNTKGMHWGSQNDTDFIKFCGIENLWGYKPKACDGITTYNGAYRYKIHAPYTDISTNYLEVSVPLMTSSSRWITAMKFGNGYGLVPLTMSESRSGAIYCDTTAGASGSALQYATVGGGQSSNPSGNDAYRLGIFNAFIYQFSYSTVDGAYLSYTPQGG